MPPKQPPKRTKSTLEKDEEARYALQAIVLCDADSSRFEPLSKETHPILFPLAGTPILAYTLEFLERGGVEEIILVCSSLPDQVRSYIQSSQWGNQRYPVKVRVITALSAHSVGDSLREVDRLSLVHSDFVLVHGGVLSNLPLASIVEEHRKRKEKDKDLMLMTMVTMQTESHVAFSPRRNLRDARLHVLDEQNSTITAEYDFHRCLVSERIEASPERDRFIHLSKEITSRHTNILFRNDLYDCNIEVCTPEVPALFTENFDYEDLRRDFVNGVLTSDLLSKNIYCYVAKSGYGRNISNFDEYSSVSTDVATGVTSPFDPTMNLENDQTFSKEASIFREKHIEIGNSTQIKTTVIGSKTIINDGAVIANSVIGRNCTIKACAVIQDSILWNNVVVESGVKFQQAIIAEENTINANYSIAGKIVLPRKTNIPSGSTLGGNNTFTVYNNEAKLYINEDQDSDSDEQDIISIHELNLTDSEVSDIDSDTDEETNPHHHRSSTSGHSDILNDEFYIEAKESLARAFLENHSFDNAEIELKTLRMATNVSFHEIREAIVAALMMVRITQPLKAKSTFERWGELLVRFLDDDEAQLDTVFIIQRFFVKQVREGNAKKEDFVWGLQKLYDVDVLSEESIFKWFEDKRANGVGEKWAEDMATLRNAAQKFITWLQEAEEESD